MSLRRRLLVALVALVAAGLLASNVATYVALRSFLVGRLDQQLQASSLPLVAALSAQIPVETLSGQGASLLPRGASAYVLDEEGRIQAALPPGGAGAPPGLAQRAQAALPASGPSPAFFLADPTDEGPPSRALAARVNDGRTLVVVLSLGDVLETLGQLLFTQLLVGAAVLAILCLSAWQVVRLGLRPLDAMTTTADAIASGDLSQRVEPARAGTEVGRLASALNTMLARIEQAFAERTASEARLRRFVADASHELRTPLTSIRGYAELFRRGASDRPADLAAAMRRIEAEAERMGALVDDLLLLARLDRGRDLDRAPVDLVAVAADAVADLRAAAPHRDISLTIDAAGGTEGGLPLFPAVVLGDGPRLHQVAANLVSNAHTHTPPEAAVRVRVGTTAASAVLTVSDDGPGLGPEQVKRVFERFYRGDLARARTSGGSGLGLSITAAIVEAHGGSVGVESTPGNGSTFRVELPLAAHPY